MTLLFLALAFVLGCAAGAMFTAAVFLALAVNTDKQRKQQLADAMREGAI